VAPEDESAGRLHQAGGSAGRVLTIALSADGAIQQGERVHLLSGLTALRTQRFQIQHVPSRPDQVRACGFSNSRNGPRVTKSLFFQQAI
jgi:hypothetical protein